MKGTDPSMKSTQLKCSHGMERTGPRKKTKASKLDGEPITLTEGDLYGIGNIVFKVTKEALQKAMMKQQNVLGALRVQLQGLMMWPPPEVTVVTYNVTGTSETKHLLWTKMDKTVVLPKGALTADNTENKAVVG